MGVLKQKEERTETDHVARPFFGEGGDRSASRARRRAGFDLNATICESIIRLTRQMRDEMDRLEGKTAGRDRSRKPATANGLPHIRSEAARQCC